MSKLAIVILAAGRGTRMKSKTPKVLHQIGGKALVSHVLSVASELKPQQVVLVVPEDHQDIANTLNEQCPGTKVDFAVQKVPQGTGDALRVALKKMKAKSGDVLVLNGDMPLITSKSLKGLLKEHRKKKASVTITTGEESPESSFGRIVRNNDDDIQAIVEFKDATPAQKQITEVNLGYYVLDLGFAKKEISNLKSQNAQKEYYLTDLVGIAVKKGKGLASGELGDWWEGLGVNSQADLSLAGDIFYQNQALAFGKKGVALVGNEIFIDADVQVQAGARLESPCYLKGKTRIGAGCVIETGCVIRDSELKTDILVKAHCYIDEARLKAGCQVGPFAHLRPQTDLSEGVKIGNFVETKKTKMGQGSKASHLTYLGDAQIGRQVNVGAGTITCNYDGKNKFKTVIKDGVFIGSNTELVAPITLEKNSFVAAGSTVTKSVSSHSLVLSRVPQVEKKNWAKNKAKS